MDEITERITSIEDTIKHYDYIKNQKFCYSCDYRMLLAKYQIKCLCNNGIYEANYVCDKYRNRFEEE